MRLNFLLFFITCSLILGAQRITDFSLSQASGSVTTSFTLRAGNICGGYRVLHSADSITYLEAISQNKPCGTSGSDEFYSDIHGRPIMNQYNYYKIQLFTFETSEARKIWVGGSAPQQAVVFPNPFNSLVQEARFRITGNGNVRVQGFIRDMNGIEKAYIDQTIPAEGGRLPSANLSEGIYSLWLTDGTNVYKGKFIVLH